MKIAYVFDSIYPFNQGGKEKRLYDIANTLSKNNDISVYTMKFWEEDKKTIKQNNITLNALSKNYPLYINKSRRSIKQAIMYALGCFKLIKYDFDIIDADHMVYMHLFPTKLISIIKNKPLIVTWNEVWGKEYWQKYLGKYKGYIGYTIEKTSSKLPDKIISVSELTTNRLINDLKVKKDKIVTIPNSINISKIDKIRPSKEKSDIIFAGRLISHKNVDLIIKSISLIKKSDKKYNNIRCIILGDGPELNNLKKLTKELSLNNNVIFKGFLKKEEDVYSYIKSSKVFAFPSEREGFGIAPLEALACGLPVITLDSKDNASKFLIKKGKTGYLTNKEEKAFSTTLKKALKSYISMTSECKEESRKYDLKQIIKSLQEVYENEIKK
jgi:glycosyltransferase involved in cell wall biosynthesis